MRVADMRVPRRSAAMVVALAAALGCGSSALAQTMPDWFNMDTMRGFRKDLPDFYQHQYRGDRPGWQGWCWPTALADCLYSFKVNGYGNLLPNSPNINMNGAANWQPDACRAIEDLANHLFTQGMSTQDYLNGAGYGERAQPGQGLKYTQYTVDQTTDTGQGTTAGRVTYQSSDGTTKVVAGNAFDLYKKELKDGQDVMIKWAHPVQTNDLWWSGPNIDGGNYHYVTGAGVDCNTRMVYFADPDSNKGSNDADAGLTGTNGRRYGPADNSPPVPPRGANMNDDPQNLNQFYQCVTLAADGFTVAASGDVNNHRYDGVMIRKIDTICPVKATTKGTTPAPTETDPDRTDTEMDFGSGSVNTIDQILLYPAFTPVTPFSTSPTPDSGFFDPSGDFWNKQFVVPSMLDPDGNTRPTGGYLFTLDLTLSPLGGLSAGETAIGDVFTNGIFNGFDILMHLKGTDPWDQGDWFRQAIGSVYGNYPLQQQIPAPASGALLIIGGIVAGRRRRNV